MTATRRSILPIIVGIAVLAGIVYYLHGRKHADDAVAANPGGSGAEARAHGGSGGGSGSGARVVPVKMAEVKRQDLPIWLDGLGTVAALQQVTVRPQVDGRLDKVLFTEGQTIKRGQVLAQIDPRPFEVQLHQAQGQLARDKAIEHNADVSYKRNLDLQKQNLIAQATVDQSAADLGSAHGTVLIDQAAIDSAELQLDYAAIKAPLDGITGVRLIDAGNIVHAADTTGLVVLTTIDPAAVLFTVPQDRLAGVTAALARGDVPVEVWNRDSTQQIGVGKLTVLDNQINQTTATLRMKAIIDNPTHALWPNEFVKARMLLETRRDVLVVPTVAIQQGPNGPFVYAVDANNVASMVPIEVDLTTGDLAIIKDATKGGLQGGERVIIEGQNQVRPGTTVKASGQGGRPGGGAANPAAGGGAGGPAGGDAGHHGHHHDGAGSGSGSDAGSGSATLFQRANDPKVLAQDVKAEAAAGSGSGSGSGSGAATPAGFPANKLGKPDKGTKPQKAPTP
jgi:multidrug efflux system membrane fusion protein